MSNWLDNITNKYVRDLTPYQSARRLFSGENDGGQLWLNANESPEAPEVTIDGTQFNRYPDCQPKKVIDAYANYCQVERSQVITTRGADEGIELLIRAFCTPGKDNILIMPPTYGMYAISAETFNVGVKKAPLLPDFTLNMPAIKECVGDVKLVFLCSPNNPTGTLLSRDYIIETLNLFDEKAIVVVDEAYIEFSPTHSVTALLAEFSNLVILRTLSKAFGLAGIRCGFALANNDIITTMLKVIAPYPMPAPVAQIASQALNTDGIVLMKERAAVLQNQLVQIKQQLSQLPSVEIVGATNANFVLFRHPDAQALMQALVKQNLFIRDQSKQQGLSNCLRITVGSKEQNQRLLAAIRAYFEITSTRNPA